MCASEQQPARLEVEQRVGVSCVSGGPVFCRVSLDRGGYVPGETIGISATVSNRSKVRKWKFDPTLCPDKHLIGFFFNKKKIIFILFPGDNEIYKGIVDRDDSIHVQR